MFGFHFQSAKSSSVAAWGANKNDVITVNLLSSSIYFYFLQTDHSFHCLSIQSRLPSPSNTHSSPSTSTGSGRRRSLWRPLRACGPFAATTADKAYPPTPTATLSCSGNSMLVCATGSCCPLASCSPVPFWSVRSFCSTRGPLAS